jgi:hypothetical protein
MKNISLKKLKIKRILVYIDDFKPLWRGLNEDFFKKMIVYIFFKIGIYDK